MKSNEEPKDVAPDESVASSEPAPEPPESPPEVETPVEPESSEEEQATPSAEPAPPAVTPPVVADTRTPQVPDGSSNHNKRRLTISLIALVVILLATGAYVFIQHHHKKAVVTKPALSSQVAKPKVNTADQFVDNYLPAPIDVSPRPNLFSDYKGLFGTDCSGQTVDYTNAAAVAACPASVTADDIIYKQIGTTKAGQAIIIVDNGVTGEGSEQFIALQTGSNTYAVLGKYDSEFTKSQYNSAAQVTDNTAKFEKELDPSTKLDLSTELADLDYPANFSFKGTSFAVDNTISTSPALFGRPLISGLQDIRGSYYGVIDTSKIATLGTYGAKTVYSVTAASDANYTLDEVYLGVNTDDAAPYFLDDGLTSTDSSKPKTPSITWKDDTTNKDTYAYRLPGCGSYYGYTVAKNVTESDLTASGTGPNNQTIYQFAPTAPLLQEIYNTDYSDGTNLDNASYKNLTLAQFQAKHVVVLARNGLGQYVVYIDNNYFTGGGCGKPVVYLYPTKTELVNVSVAADVKKSDPLYGPKGWINVLARPNGQLTYQGANYPNLYWEGTGDGVYPAVSEGTVVASNDAVPTIRQQLSQQGLASSEISDFLAYWQPRLPNTPYVRLTWFNTEQMNQLAPLSVSPKPDTLIRVFLDFQGLNHQVSIPAQHFTAYPARSGFTVVEWGGLDRSAR